MRELISALKDLGLNIALSDGHGQNCTARATLKVIE